MKRCVLIIQIVEGQGDYREKDTRQHICHYTQQKHIICQALVQYLIMQHLQPKDFERRRRKKRALP